MALGRRLFLAWGLSVVSSGALACGGAGSNTGENTVESGDIGEATSQGEAGEVGEVGGGDMGVEGACVGFDERFVLEEVPSLPPAILADEIAFALTPDGRPAVAYRAMEDGIEKLIYTERAPGGAWEETSLTAGGALSGLALAFSSDGRPHLLHAASVPGAQTVLRVREGSEWGSTVVSAQGSKKNDLFTAPDGSVHGIFSEGGVVLLLRPDGADGWETVWLNTASPDPVLMVSSGLGIDAVYDDDGVMHASHSVSTGALVHSALDADLPMNTEIGATSNEELTAIAVDGSGGLHVAFHRATPEELTVASLGTGGWTLSSVEAGASSAGLLISQVDRFHLFHIDAAGELRYGSADGAVPSLLDGVVGPVGRARYAIDEQGRPHFLTRAGDQLCWGSLAP